VRHISTGKKELTYLQTSSEIPVNPWPPSEARLNNFSYISQHKSQFFALRTIFHAESHPQIEPIIKLIPVSTALTHVVVADRIKGQGKTHIWERPNGVNVSAPNLYVQVLRNSNGPLALNPPPLALVAAACNAAAKELPPKVG
jgi:hypothetical protein